MSLNDLSDIGQFISSIAVLASLIYVAIQIRQTERNQRAMILQGRAARTADIAVTTASPEIAAMLTKASRGAELSEEEFTQFFLVFRAWLTNYEDIFLQRQERLVGDAAFEGARNGLRSLFSRPNVRAMWEVARPEHGPEFVAFIDELLKDTPEDRSPFPALFARYHAELARLNGAATAD